MNQTSSQTLEQLLDDLIESAQLQTHYIDVDFNPKREEEVAEEVKKIKLAILALNI